MGGSRASKGVDPLCMLFFGLDGEGSLIRVQYGSDPRMRTVCLGVHWNCHPLLMENEFTTLHNLDI